jgi:hypothetical protein
MVRRSPEPLCEDFHCPALWACERAFARSLAYAAMEIPGPELVRFREPGADSCAGFVPAIAKPHLARAFDGCPDVGAPEQLRATTLAQGTA